MSQTDLDRFAAAVSRNPALAQDYKEVASAAEMAARLRADGYDVSDAELEDAARSGRDLSDEQLDQVTGGSLGLIFGALTAVGAVATFGTLAVLAIVHGVKPPKAG